HSFPTRRSSDLAAGVPAQLSTESRCRSCESSGIVPGTTPARARTLWCDRVGPLAGTGGRCLPHLPGTAACRLGCADRDDGTGAVASGIRTGERDPTGRRAGAGTSRSEEHTSELQSRFDLVCRLLLEKKKEPVGPRGRP